MSLDRTERTGLPEHGNDIKRAVDKGVWAEPEQDSWDRAAGTGEPGQKAGTQEPGRTAGIGQLGEDSRDKTARTGKPGQEYWDREVRKTARIGNRGGTARI